MLDVALEIPLRLLAFARARQRDHAALARVEHAGEHVDRAALAGGVAAFEDDDQALAGLGDPARHLAELLRQWIQEYLILLKREHAWPAHHCPLVEESVARVREEWNTLAAGVMRLLSCARGKPAREAPAAPCAALPRSGQEFAAGSPGNRPDLLAGRSKVRPQCRSRRNSRREASPQQWRDGSAQRLLRPVLLQRDKGSITSSGPEWGFHCAATARGSLRCDEELLPPGHLLRQLSGWQRRSARPGPELSVASRMRP